MKRGVIIFWSLFVGCAMVRVLFSLHQDVVTIGTCNKRLVTGLGTIIQEPERKEGGQVMVVSVTQLFPATTSAHTIVPLSSDSCTRDTLIRMKTKLYPRFVYGDEISFSGKISQPINFRSDTGRSFDYIGYLAKDDVFFEIKSATAEHISTIRSGNAVSRGLFYLKRRFVAHLEKVLGEPHAALAAGLVVGEKSALGKDLLNDFRIVGLIHIVVLSGFNITIVGDAMRRILSFLPRVWGITVGGLGIALFGVMVGGGATVVRSCFMAGVALSADLIRRDYQVTRALIFAGLIMLIQHPSILLHDPSFQLSFLATLGLILLASPIEKKLTFVPEKCGMRGIVAATIATQIFVSPYILYMMGTMSIIGMVVNILVLPIIPLTMLVVFLTGATGFISITISEGFGWVAHWLLSYELKMVDLFADVPFASVTLPQFSGWWVVGFYTLFVLIYLERSGSLKASVQKPRLNLGMDKK
jgi:competence protein ComEC